MCVRACACVCVCVCVGGGSPAHTSQLLPAMLDDETHLCCIDVHVPSVVPIAAITAMQLVSLRRHARATSRWLHSVQKKPIQTVAAVVNLCHRTDTLLTLC